MKEKSVLKIESELKEAIYRTIGEFTDCDMSVDVKLVVHSEINAGVGRILNKNKEYRIEINTGVIESLQQALEEKYMVNLNEDDFLSYQFAETGIFFRYFDDSTLKNSFMNGMAKFIGYNIVFHECGHILLGHCDRGAKKITEKNSRNNGKMGYGHQARELMAD